MPDLVVALDDLAAVSTLVLIGWAACVVAFLLILWKGRI